MLDFSVIIPVYNGMAAGLPRCLDSVWAQPVDTGRYEVICVDDCSTDGTLAWLSEQQAEHANLRVLTNQANLRQGGGRNRGMREARGRYIVFLDQDDYLHEGSLLEAMRCLGDGDLEVLVVDNSREVPGKPSDEMYQCPACRDVMAGDEFIARGTVPFQPWNYVFLLSFAIENEVYFVEHEPIEDVDWVYLLLHCAQRVQHQPILLVHNVISASSTSMSSHIFHNTVYSHLRLSRRLQNLHDTRFQHSSTATKEQVLQAREITLYRGLRQLFFFGDKARIKAKNIRENAAGPSGAHQVPRLNRLARRHPVAFATISNLLSPLARRAMLVWRRYKYT